MRRKWLYNNIPVNGEFLESPMLLFVFLCCIPIMVIVFQV